MVCGVYEIVNTVSNRRYVGSALDVKARIGLHFSLLHRQKHTNPHLTASFMKYGRDAFTFGLLEECVPECLIEREQHWIDTLKPRYNIRTRAESNRGLKPSAESNIKRSASLKRALASPEAREVKRQRSREIWTAEGYRDKHSASMQAHWTPEQRKAWGKQMRAEGRDMAAARAAWQANAGEVNAKRSATLKRTLASPEARATKARTIREAWADPEQKARRIAALKAAWTPEKRAAWSERMQHVDTKAKEAREVRWAKPGAHQRASETLQRLHAEGRMVRHHSEATKRKISETKRRRSG